MIQLTDHLAFGPERICTHDTTGTVAVVHACKEPCHRRAVGYATRTIPSNHPHYLVKQADYHLYLNLIDPPQPLFMMPSFVAFLAFVDQHIADRRVLIHCNQGESRAPSLALLYLAKRTDRLPAGSYPQAAEAFRASMFPGYNPGRGIQTWLTQRWSEIA
jgi:predicted protein tyrosine phosphatase